MNVDCLRRLLDLSGQFDSHVYTYIYIYIYTHKHLYIYAYMYTTMVIGSGLMYNLLVLGLTLGPRLCVMICPGGSVPDPFWRPLRTCYDGSNLDVIVCVCVWCKRLFVAALAAVR